jgi:hypothetical protein
MATPGQPLLGSWPNPGGVNIPGAPTTGGTPSPIPSTGSLPAGPAGTPGVTNPFGGGSRGGGNEGYNLSETNLQTGTYKNALLPLFASGMFGSAGPAAQFFQQLMNLGSPFYQQKQQQSFEQGTQQANNAAAQARQQLQASGQGSGPSGAGAAMFGGEAQAAAGNEEEAFLNNLFQNEQLQASGASGLMSMAQLFNPAQLTGQQTSPNIQQPTNTGAQWMSAIAQLMGAASSGAQTGSNIEQSTQ